MTKVLDAPCVFCGYNGEGYWQVHTHSSECPWWDVAGKEARKEAIRGIIEEMARRGRMDWRNVQSLQQKLSASNARVERLTKALLEIMALEFQGADEVVDSILRPGDFGEVL